MAKLSRDDTSWRAHGLKQRAKDWENDPKAGRRKNKKNSTKRWCKGIEGNLHDIRNIKIGILACYDCRRRKIPCLHPRTIRKCIKCNKRYPYPGRQRSQRDNTQKELAAQRDNTQKELAARWCTEGHLWDWSKFDNKGHVSYFQSHSGYVAYRGRIGFWTTDHQGEKQFQTPWRMPRVHKICLMCGLERKSQSREITPDDL